MPRNLLLSGKRAAVLASGLASVLLVAVSIPALGTSIDTTISPFSNEAAVRYESIQVLNIKYPNGGDIGSKLTGENIHVSVKLDSSDPAIQNLMNDMNAYLLRERESPTQVTDLRIDYTGELRGLEDFAVLSQKMTVHMKINGYVMGELMNGEAAKIVDLNWRTFVISQPVFVQTDEYGMMDINRPSGFLAATMPTLLNKLAAEGTTELLSSPALDFSKLSLPMEKWRWNYDSDEHITVVATAAGIDSPLHPERKNISFEHEGIPYGLELNIPAPSGTIQIIGFAKAYAAGGDAALVYEQPDVVTEITPMSVQVLLALGGIMAAIAIMVLLKARK